MSQVLEATTDVAGREDDVYRAVHALFTLIPARLVPGSVFLVRTQDVDHAVELAWDAREEPREGYAAGQGLLAAYEPTEPVAGALRELERVCNVRAGYVRASYEEIKNSSSFPRRPFLHRRVIAHLPLPPGVAEARALQAKAVAEAPKDVQVDLKPKRDDAWRAMWPVPRPRSAAPRRARK